MDSSEYFVRRAWDCYHLLVRSTDHHADRMICRSERDFIAKAIDAGVPAKILPPPVEVGGLGKWRRGD